MNEIIDGHYDVALVQNN